MTDPVDIVNALRALGDRAYVIYIEQMRRDECLGWEHKVKTGKFGERELAAHGKASEHLGRHRAFHAAADLVEGTK